MQLAGLFLRLGVQLLAKPLTESLIEPQRLRSLADASIAPHQRARRVLVQVVAREQATIRIRRFRVALLLRVPVAELHQRVDEQALQPIAMLELPVARRLAVQEIAAESRDRALECRNGAVFPTLQRPPRRDDLALELRDVELRDHFRIDSVAVVRRA